VPRRRSGGHGISRCRRQFRSKSLYRLRYPGLLVVVVVVVVVEASAAFIRAIIIMLI
jgi:hypothetical protein